MKRSEFHRAPLLRQDRARAAAVLSAALLLTLSACGGDASLSPGAPYAVAVIALSPGPRAGFGADRLPDVVLGPPRGAGLYEGSLDVLSLGVGGVITLELGVTVVDGPGADLIVFENPFRFGRSVFVEPALVSLSEGGGTFVEVPCSFEPTDGYRGCVGVSPVLANADDNDIDATDPAVAGGDAVDLADAGLTRARFVRIVDSGLDLGGFGIDNAGFDLDAIAVVHGE